MFSIFTNFCKMKNEIPIYAIDFEGSKKIGVVEFGAVGIHLGEIFFANTSMCKPRARIDKKSENLTGISNEEANKFPPFENFEELFVQMRQNGMLAAHNYSAEDSMLRSHIPSPSRVKNFLGNKDTLSWSPWLDSQNFAKFLDKNLESLKLSDVIKSLNLQDELDVYAEKICEGKRRKWHCALYDALASAIIIKRALVEIKDFDEFKSVALSNAQADFENFC